MGPKPRFWRSLSVLTVISGLAFVAISHGAPRHISRIKELRAEAEAYEKQGNWAKARDLYAFIHQLDRGRREVKARYQHCHRRCLQVERHGDPSYRKEVLSLGLGHSLRLYDLMVETLIASPLDKKKKSNGQIFRKGLDELRMALDDAFFRQTYLTNVKEDVIRGFRDQLKGWEGAPVRNRDDLLERVREVALAASQALDLDATLVVMEFTCGACYALDEYTSYLTPLQLRDLVEAVRGQTVGIGITLGVRDGQFIVVNVIKDSPAYDKNLQNGDRILRIDRKNTTDMTVEAAQQLLEGAPGTKIDLIVESAGMGMQRTLRLTRRIVHLPSVHPGFPDYVELGITPTQAALPIGYLAITSFQDNTLRDLDAALETLNKAQIKALILDLRGNRGGLFEAAIETAKRFIPSGVITSTQNTDPSANKIYEANGVAAINVPIVVLIDGDTASAAEVLAGALKENNRARLVGTTTFGKGCTQKLFQLPPGPGNIPTGGIRLTITRFFSPTGQPYSGRGVTPNILSERDELGSGNPQLVDAIAEAERLVLGQR